GEIAEIDEITAACGDRYVAIRAECQYSVIGERGAAQVDVACGSDAYCRAVELKCGWSGAGRFDQKVFIVFRQQEDAVGGGKLCGGSGRRHNREIGSEGERLDRYLAGCSLNEHVGSEREQA